MYINVIGAGLAGCECAYQIAKRGINVRLFEMKPTKKTAAHKSDLFCELICSNSLKALRIESAAGLLKEEMRRLDSLLMRCADKCAVPAGGALAVNRDDFSAMVTKEIRNNPLIEVIEKEVTEIPNNAITVIAAGPLASEVLSAEIQKICGGGLSFFDAAAPIVTAESIDMEKAFFASRYDKGGDDAYINCPMNKFVAGFIGSPQMNFYDVKVDGKKLIFADGNTVELPEAIAKRIAGYSEVIMGIRGEDIKFDITNLDVYGSHQKAVIDNTEIMGNENNLYFDFGGSVTIARVSKYEVSQVGDEVEFTFMPHKMHFFDKETEQVIGAE